MMNAKREQSIELKLWLALLLVLSLASLCNHLKQVQEAHAFQSIQIGVTSGRQEAHKPERPSVYILAHGQGESRAGRGRKYVDLVELDSSCQSWEVSPSAGKAADISIASDKGECERISLD